MKRRFLNPCLIALGIVLLGSGWWFLVGGVPKRLEEKLRSSSLSEWALEHPQNRISKITKDGIDYYEIGLPPEFCKSWLSSSRAVAIFDAKGVFVEWTSDSGDDRVYQDKWQSGTTSVPIDFAQLPK